MSAISDNLPLSQSKPPAGLLPWLTYQHSLTEKLKKLTGNAFLTVLQHQWQQPDWWMRHFLNINEESVLCREIVTSSNDFPCWFARTVIPSSCYQQHSQCFERLKQEPLGHLIFDENQLIERLSLRHYVINSRCIEYQWLAAPLHGGVDELWMRLSAFSLEKNGCFFLAEIFLPGFMELIC